MAIAAMLHNARLWNRCNDTASSDVSLSLRRSFELPSDSKWIGLSSSLTRRDEGPRMDPCRLPALRPASGKFARLEERARRKEKSRKRGASVRSKTRAASNGSKPRQPRQPRPLPRATGQGLECPRDQDIRPKSSFSELSLPSPRDSRENEDMLSASAVLRAALTGSFLDDESLELQLSDPPYTWSPYSSSQDENNDSKCANSQPSRDVDDYNLSATNLLRCTSYGERVPLSTLQLLEAEVASQSGKPCKDSCPYSLPSDRSDRLPCIEGPSKAATEISRAGAAGGRISDVRSEAPDGVAKRRLDRRRLPSYLRPRQTPTEEQRRNSSRPRKPSHEEARKLQRAQSVS
eukprot:s552_g11.t1